MHGLNNSPFCPKLFLYLFIGPLTFFPQIIVFIRHVYNNPEIRKRATIACFWKKILQGACSDVFTRPTLLGFHANGRNIVALRFAGHRTIEMLGLVGPMQTDPTLLGPTMLWLVAFVCMEPQQCWHLLALVAYSLKQVKLLAQQVPIFLLFCDRRSVAQQCCVRLHGTATILANVGLVKTSAHAPCNIFFSKTNNRSAFSYFWIVVNTAYQAKFSE